MKNLPLPTLRRHSMVLLILIACLQIAACSDDNSSDGNSSDNNSSDDSVSVMLPDSETDVKATIRRTTNGVPHIASDTLEGVAFGAGYAQAQDNVCLLAESFVKARSERAKFFGPGTDNAYVFSDFSYKALRILSGAEIEYPQLSAEATALLDGFAAGYNHYVTSTDAASYPAPCTSEPWVAPIRPQDLLAYYRIVGQYASGNFFVGAPLMFAVPPGVEVAPTMVTASTSPSDSTGFVEPWESVLKELQQSAPDKLTVRDSDFGSNAWGIGRELSENGRGALLANPHFPYTGPRRFYQMHMTVPGYLDVNGAGLLGTALPLIGFNQNLGWSHTVSTSRRFTFYELTLKQDDDLVYIKDGQEVPITSETYQVEVANGTATPTVLEREFYYSEYGPMLSANVLSNGSLGSWGTERRAYTYRDANASLANFLDTWLGMSRASNLAQFEQVFRDCGNTRWTNTTYADDQGNAFYIDSSAVPDLSDEAQAVIASKRDASPVFNAFFEDGLTLLDGSTSRDDWLASGCGGIVPFEKRPKLVRGDFVQNSNDSYWSTNPAEPLTGYSSLFGSEETSLSARTRLGLTMVQNPSDSGFADTAPAGQDAKFGAEDLINVIYNNRSYFAETLLPELRERCLLIGAGAVNLSPESTRSVDQACNVLATWDGVYNVDSVGAHVFRVFMGQYADQLGVDYTVAFSADDPVNTPSTPDSANRGGATDTMLVALARAAELLESASVPYQATLGDVQRVQKSGGALPAGTAVELGNTIAWHGATGFPDGGFNAIGAVGQAVAEDTLFPRIPQPTLAGSGGLSENPVVFWRIDRGTSWHFGLEFNDDGPRAFGLLSYSQSSDPASPYFNDQSIRYSEKNYRPLLFTEADIEANLLQGGMVELMGARVEK